MTRELKEALLDAAQEVGEIEEIDVLDEKGMLGTNIRELTLPPNDAIGQRAYDAVANAPEGTIVTMDYELPKPGTKKPAPKQSFEVRVGNQACGELFQVAGSSSPGTWAKFTAIRRASSLVSRLAAARRPGSPSK